MVTTSRITRAVRTAAAGGLGVVLAWGALAAAGPAARAAGPGVARGCDTGSEYAWSGITYPFIRTNDRRYETQALGADITLTVTKTTSATVGASSSGGAGLTLSGEVLSLSAQVNRTVMTSHAYSSDVSGSYRTVSSGWTWLAFGAAGVHGSFSYGHYANGSCSWVQQTSGAVSGPDSTVPAVSHGLGEIY